MSLQLTGLSHSEIPGSRVICTSPGLIAAYHVLHRLREPRHPPCALSYFLFIVHTIASAGDIYFQLVLKILLFEVYQYVIDLFLWRSLWIGCVHYAHFAYPQFLT